MQKWSILSGGLVAILTCGAVVANAQSMSRRAPLTQPQLQQEAAISMRLLLNNLQAPGIAPGAVIASPSQRDPDYFYHWVRDAGLVMGTVLDLAPLNRNAPRLLGNWMTFENHLREQSVAGPGLGEPKFHVNGEVFRGPWGRPQNDGPAIRAWTMLRVTGRLDEGIKKDLDYLQREWMNPDFDLWEEVKGTHFFTRYAQMAAFRQAAIATRQNAGLSREYAAMAQKIENTLGLFVDPRTKLVTPTLPGSQGVQKHSGLDISVILAIAYFGPTPNWSVSNPYVLNTLHRMEEAFSNIYVVNKNYTDMAPGLGRYPEDVYDGNGFGGGNPWYLATFGAAEFYCNLIDDLGRAGAIRFEPLNVPFYETALGASITPFTQVGRDQEQYWQIMQGLQSRAMSFIQRALFHAGPDRRYAEQFDRVTGFRRGAKDLTWSYAASLRAFQRCQGTLQALESRRK
ncbi:MAG: glycoside hydrolase family 15 protein [Bdellovibrionaceae bacterium]|nr:glycoside hydrolase family 15 protein [Pseudobdellovibrionaceae bacterium]